MSENQSGFDRKFIRELAELLAETDLTEIEVEGSDVRIRVARDRAVRSTTEYLAPAPLPNPASAQPAAPQSTPAEPAPASTPSKNDPGLVGSPMVGTVYLAPSPGARPFVEAGGKVKEGDTVLIVEAMKTMNQIPSPRAGTVKEVLVTDGQPVEYGEPLMIIE